MPLYEKPVRLLMRDMVNSLAITPGKNIHERGSHSMVQSPLSSGEGGDYLRRISSG
jgi:hypothetical protein